MPIDLNWLNQVREPILEPELPIIDPHHHLWDYTDSRYLADDLIADIRSPSGAHNVVATVFVECGWSYRKEGPESLRPVGETEFVERVGAAHENSPIRVAAGIVGFADLAIGAAVQEVLQAHLAASPKRFRGIRHAAGWHASDEIRNSHSNPPPGLFAVPRFREGFAQLKPLGLSFEAWLYHTQLHELLELARAFPDTSIVLDHFGGPLGIGPFVGQSDEVFARWRADTDELARCPNVVAKLGGLNMAINGYGWHRRPQPPTSQELVNATGRYYLYAIEKFGPARCMFESNFPVDKLSCSYPVVWNAFKRLASQASKAEKAALFHDTAAHIYKV
ncbi:MAG TPA: amidohydrolase family protein [Steroidobacteraceae bacterium]|nr:amidohydrolase family protein [Steroidobacteraceae bacterium]